MATNPIISRGRRLEVASDAQIRRAPEGQVLKAAGCKGLFLENRHGGTGVWRFRQASRAGGQVQARLGEWPAMTLEEAVVAAIQARQDLAAGRRPLLEREKKAAAVAAVVEERRAEAARQTFQAAARAYFAFRKDSRLGRRGMKALRSPHQLEKLLGYACDTAISAGRFGDLELASIRPEHVDELHEVMTTTRGPVLANRVISRITTLYEWAARPAGPIPGHPSPVRGIALNDEAGRERVLDADELRRLWVAADGMDFPYGPFFRLLCWTACRGGELLGLRWSKDGRHGYYDAKARTIEFPITKNGRPHTVHLPDQAVALLDSLPRFAGSEFVFSASGKRREFRPHLKDRLSELSGVTDWTLHDVRRTAVSNMAALGVAPAVAAKVIGHTSEGPVKGTLSVYLRHAFTDERRAALQAWADEIDRIITTTEETTP
jgi:integrase